MNRTAIVVLVLVLAACVSVGRPYRADAVADLKPGITTEAEAAILLGRPPTHRQSYLSDGNPPSWEPGDHFLAWVHGRWAFGRGVSGRSLVLMFDRAGTLKEIVRQTEIQRGSLHGDKTR